MLYLLVVLLAHITLTLAVITNTVRKHLRGPEEESITLADSIWTHATDDGNILANSCTTTRELFATFNAVNALSNTVCVFFCSVWAQHKLPCKLHLSVNWINISGPIEPVKSQEIDIGHLPNELIVGGDSVSIENFPYQLSLRVNGVHLCGAAIISVYWVITAGHCVFNRETSLMSLQAGSTNRLSGGIIYQIFISVIHPQYNPTTVDYDFALLLVSNPIWSGPTINAIALPSTINYIADGTESVVSGWGALTEGNSTEPADLKAVTVFVIKNSVCNKYYPGHITSRMMCAGYLEGGKDSCQGDSGTPLAVDKVLVGIASWGSGCGRKNAPGVYSRVSSVRNWIYNVAHV